MDKISTCKKTTLFLISIMIIFSAYFAFLNRLSPDDEPEPQTYQPCSMPTLPPIHQDQLLAQSTKYIDTQDVQTFNQYEDIEVDDQGNIYLGNHQGYIIKISNESKLNKTYLWSPTKKEGGVMGISLSLDKQHLLYISTTEGLCKLDLQTNQRTILFDQVDGKKFKQITPNSFAESSSGKIYLTITTDKFNFSQFLKQFVISKSRGSLWQFDIQTSKLQLVYSGLYFANGVVLQQGQQSVLVAETSRYRIRRIWVAGPKKGDSQILIDNLPGIPDNINLINRNQLWIGVPIWRDAIQEFLFSGTKMRRIVIGLGLEPLAEIFTNTRLAGGIKINTNNGQVMEYFVGSNKKIHTITTVLEKNKKLYLLSLKFDKVCIVNRNIIIEKGNNQKNDQDL